METYYSIPTSDGFEIKWVLNSQTNSQRLVIFVHGFTGSMSEAHYYCAKEFFISRGYDVFRFNLYTDGENTRKLRDCSIKLHSQDILRVVQEFWNYAEIFLVGHSLAGPCLSGVASYPQNVAKMVFWDPAFEMKTTALKCYGGEPYYHLQASGKHIEVSPEMYQEFLDDSYIEILREQDFSKENIFAIYASDDRHVHNKAATDALGIESCIIEWANHGFTQEGKYKELFEKTLEYIEK